MCFNIKTCDKNRFFGNFSKILKSHFSIAHDDFNDIYDDDVNRRICIVYEYITEIRVFVHYSNTARAYNLDIH